MSPIKRQHRPIDLQRPTINGKMLYQAMCACGRKAVIGTRVVTEKDQKNHRREEVVNGLNRTVQGQFNSAR